MIKLNKIFKSPPALKTDLTAPETLCIKLKDLIGGKFELTGKTRTDGSNIRKLIASTLYDSNNLPSIAPKGTYEIIPPKGKGVPKILLEYIDSYMVTTGDTYNLQVWNRNPAAQSVQVEYSNGDVLLSADVRFVFTKISVLTNTIESITILTPKYITDHFGEFGKPTIKHQLLINSSKREELLSADTPILFYPDVNIVNSFLTDEFPNEGDSIHDFPKNNKVLKLEIIYELVKNQLIGTKLDAMPTKNRGQALELKVAELLGYSPKEKELLAGGYPDIRNQMLEVKVQDSQTIDLGKYSPQFEERIHNEIYTTTTIRYLIALTNPLTSIIEGVILCPGEYLGHHFTYVSDKSFKTQRSIPMSFFNRFSGEVVYNPEIDLF